MLLWCLKGCEHLNSFEQEQENNLVGMQEQDTPEVTQTFIEPPRWHFITYWIAGINILVYMAMSLTGSTSNLTHLVEYGAKVNAYIADGQYYRLITPMFLHGGLAHLAFNTMALIQLGVATEYSFGKKKFVAIYFVSGLTASIGSFLFNDAISVGASGAIFGLFGANLFLYTLNPELYKRVYRLDTIGMIVANIAFGFMIPSIDNFGHIFGLIGGFLFCWGFVKTYHNEDRKAFRYLAAFLLVAFISSGMYFGIPKEKASDNYQYTYALLSFLNNDAKTGIAYLEAGLQKHPESTKLNDLVNRLVEAEIIQKK